MIIRLAHHEYKAVCDDCDYYEIYSGDFRSVVNQIKEDDWSVVKNEDEVWQHYCYECKD